MDISFNFKPIRPFNDTITIATPIEIVSSPVGYFDKKSEVEKILIIMATANNQ